MTFFIGEGLLKYVNISGGTGLWQNSNVGHAKIVGEVGAVGNSDYMIPRYDFTRMFKILVPDKGIWKGGANHMVRKFIQIRTDGSTLNGSVDSGIFSEWLSL